MCKLILISWRTITKQLFDLSKIGSHNIPIKVSCHTRRYLSLNLQLDSSKDTLLYAITVQNIIKS